MTTDPKQPDGLRGHITQPLQLHPAEFAGLLAERTDRPDHLAARQNQRRRGIEPQAGELAVHERIGTPAGVLGGIRGVADVPGVDRGRTQRVTAPDLGRLTAMGRRRILPVGVDQVDRGHLGAADIGSQPSQ